MGFDGTTDSEVPFQVFPAAEPPAGIADRLVSSPSPRSPEPGQVFCLWWAAGGGRVLVVSAERRPVRLPLGRAVRRPIVPGEALS